MKKKLTRRERCIKILTKSKDAGLTSTELAQRIAKAEGITDKWKIRNMPASLSSLLLIMNKEGIIGRLQGGGPRGGMLYYLKSRFPNMK